MATPQAIQSAGDAAETMHVYHILQSVAIDGTYDAHYCVGIVDPYQGRSRWCQTTSASSAADQNTEILAALTA